MNKVFAPWTIEQIVNLEEYQRCGMVHPFTCPNDGADLVATVRGWICRFCDHTQDWAFEGMTEFNKTETYRVYEEYLKNIRKI